MPLKGKVGYSKPVTLKNGKKTLALYSKKHKLLEYRACKGKKDGKFKCPTNKTEKKKLASSMGINPLNKKLYEK